MALPNFCKDYGTRLSVGAYVASWDATGGSDVLLLKGLFCLQLRLPRPRKVASHVSITTEAFAFLKKHDDCARSEGGGRSHGGRVKAANFCWTFVEPHIIPAEHSAPSIQCSMQMHRKI